MKFRIDYRRICHIGAVFAAIMLCIPAHTFIAAQCCIVPTTVTTGPAGVYNTTYVEFNEAISDANDDSFDGYYVQEAIGGVGSNSCYWGGSTLQENPNISGGVWTVGGGSPSGPDALQGPPTYNTWGYDIVRCCKSAALAARLVHSD